MKRINFGLGLVALLALSSCADDKFSEFRTDMTQNKKDYLYLNNYEPLKKYVQDLKDAGKCNPDFKLGVALAASEFNEQGFVYCLAGSNFDEMTAGNAMKYASCVDNKGVMNFDNVSSFVANAKDAGLTIYGHTLAWHSQQNKKYLNGLIADRPAPEEPGGDNMYIRYTTAAAGANPWDNQANYKLSEPLEKGASYTLTMKVKASEDCDIAFWPIWNASPNKNQWGGSNDVQYCASQDISTKWTTLTWNFEALFTHDLLQFCFGMLKNNESVSIDDITLVKEGTEENLVANGDFAQNATAGWGNNYQGPTFKCEKIGSGIPLTDKEKKEVLTTALDKWIDGMMAACDGYVTTWDLANETLSGQDKDGDGWYDLQSVTRGTVSAADAAANFYWQDYLGDIDYVRIAAADARKSFAEHNGDPDKLKLFINDYNLETDYDNNQKLKSLIHWIGEWEKDGVTKIDGIGSQMHISCYADEATNESKKNAIVNMLKLMAESGKLCKISELDMAYVDASGNTVPTTKMTEEQHKQMRDLYEFVVSKYFEIIPLAQQYGITQWCATDSPDTTGAWRKGCPTGLWDSNYLRKHTYAGFAAGLGAPEYWKENAE